MFVRGCEKFLPAFAYLFCLALPGSCLARFTYFFWEHCRRKSCSPILLVLVRSYEHLAIGSFNVLMSFEFDFTYIDGQHGRNQQHVFVRICEYDDD